MRLIGVGMPRTGTLTQKEALELLGFAPCYHWVNILADLSTVELWDRAMDGEAIWPEVFEGFEASVDWPGGFFWRQLIDTYPEAKVLLSVRDPEAWEQSFRETVWSMGHGGSLVHLLSSARATVDRRWQRYVELVERMFWSAEGTFAAGHETPAELIEAFERHNEEVKRAVPAEHLLVWEAAEGWEPLCAFLGVDVPSEPFPRANDRETFTGRVIDGALTAIQASRAGAH
jgi:Sulfotransferase domain